MESVGEGDEGKETKEGKGSNRAMIEGVWTRREFALRTSSKNDRDAVLK